MTDELKALIEKLKKNTHHTRIIADGYRKLSSDERLIFQQQTDDQMVYNKTEFEKLINSE